MYTEKLAGKISALLPDRDGTINDELTDRRNEASQVNAENIVRKQTARELAEMKAKEKARLKREQKKLQDRLDKGIADGRTEFQQKAVDEQEALVATVEALEDRNRSQVPGLIKSGLAAGVTPRNAALLQTTTPREVAKLLASLNINLNLQLTKSDTSNLLACLLTCNETQLNALYNNKKIPVAIKTVIKRLLEDAKLGNIETVNTLWDRLFGKAGLQTDARQAEASGEGLVPGTPISREAYIILRDTILK